MVKAFISALFLLSCVVLNSSSLKASDSIETLRGTAGLSTISAASVKELPSPDIPAVTPALEPAAAAENRVAAPKPDVTPGNICTPNDPNFKEYRYAEHIAYCNRNVTKEMKLQVAASYNVPQSDWTNYEFDHLIPLCIGGDSSVDNLWPEPRGATESDGKDVLENALYKQMVAGTITQKAAVQQIYDWFKRYATRHPEVKSTPLAALL